MGIPMLDGIRKKAAMGMLGKSFLFGGLPGAAMGAAVDKDKRWRGALIGGAAGTGLGYLTGHILKDRPRKDDFYEIVDDTNKHLKKTAGLGSALGWGMRSLQRNPRLGASVAGGLAGGGIGLVTGGDMKSTLAGAGLGAAGGYGLNRAGVNFSPMWQKARGGFSRFRRGMRAPIPAAGA